MKNFRNTVHRAIVGFSLVIGSMELSKMISSFISFLNFYFLKIDTPEIFYFIIQVLFFIILLNKTVYYTKFTYKSKGSV